MSWDIYGEPLRRGHCEVHPHVHEEYPCSVCIAEKRSSDQQGGCRGGCESGHYLGQAQEHIKVLEQERDDLAAHVERLQGAIRAAISSDWSVPAEEALEEALDDKAAASLARLKAQWQAEALNEMASAMREAGRQFLTEEELELSAHLIHRQAGGGEA